MSPPDLPPTLPIHDRILFPRIPQLHPNARPKINWSRTLYCYLTETEESEDEEDLVSRLEGLLTKWKTEVAKSSDQVTENSQGNRRFPPSNPSFP
jgi:hypothetical protein|tara:strand:+ start:2968 stop:3252 length:285 start_codon:yes stop_codon:yes gene_type:complete